MMMWKEYVEQMGEKRNAVKILVGKPKGIRIPICGWKDNITMDVKINKTGSLRLDLSDSG
jgi:hypothetical protein